VKAVDFGFLFARIMRFYGMAFREVLTLPIQTFWMLHRNVDRVVAEENYKSAIIAASAMGGDGLTTLLEDLRKQMGDVVIVDEAKLAMQEAKLDREGLNSLRGLGRVVP
jgi:hypothetical protein